MPTIAELTTDEFDPDDHPVGVVPTGSTEQHGPALPLGTDTTVASALADAVADRPDVAVAPPVPVGISPHHRHFAGTLWVDETTFRRYVEDVVRSLAAHGVDRVVLVNGHGGNVDALRQVGRRLRGEGTAFAVPWNWWQAVESPFEDEFDDDGGHACHDETSMMYAVDGASVREDRLADAEAGAPPGWGSTVRGGDVGLDTVDFTPTGAVGRPTAATPAAGEAMLEAAEAELTSLIDWLVERPRSELLEDATPLHPER